MKKKKLVIFFLALIPIYIIYNLTYEENFTYLSLGDDLAKGHTPFETYGNSYTDYVYTYLKNKNDKITLNKDFIEEDLRITDLIEKLKNADTQNGNTLPQVVKDADIITISIGSEELFSKIRSNYELYSKNNTRVFKYIDELMSNLETLITEMKKITKGKIYIIGYYSPIQDNEASLDSIFNYLDIKFKTLEKKHKINYVSIYEGFKSSPHYLPNPNHAFPSLEGYNYIATKIIEKIESN